MQGGAGPHGPTGLRVGPGRNGGSGGVKGGAAAAPPGNAECFLTACLLGPIIAKAALHTPTPLAAHTYGSLPSFTRTLHAHTF